MLWSSPDRTEEIIDQNNPVQEVRIGPSECLTGAGNSNKELVG